MSGDTRMEISTSSLSATEAMLLAQLVHEHGNTAWPVISQTLSGHPLLDNTLLKDEGIAQAMYTQLMKELEVDMAEGYPEGAKPKAKQHVQLARKHFMARVYELRAQIAAEEETFKTLYREIEEIKAGIWDDRIAAEVAAAQPTEEPKDELEAITEEAGIGIEQQAKLEETALEKQTAQEEGSPLPVLADVPTLEDPPASKKKGKKVAANRRSSRTAKEEAPSRERSEVPEAIPEEEEDAGTPSVAAEEEEEAPVAKKPRKGTKAVDRKRKRTATPATDRESPAPSTRNKRMKTEEADTPTLSTAEEKAALKKFRASILQILSQITADSRASIFLSPVRESEAPGYHSLIKHPMDLKTMGKKVREGSITTSQDFRKELLLIFANAVMFNPPESEYARAAHELCEVAEGLVHVYDSLEV